MAGTLSIYAQTSVTGTITDAHTHTPVAGATVVVPHTSIATISDSRGQFVLSSKHIFNTIVVSSIGYTPQQLNVENGSTNLDISFVPAANLLSPVEVQSVKQAQSISTLTNADLNRFSGLNIQDALNTIPGVNMQSRTPWGGQRIILRGYYPSVDNGRNNSANFAGLGYQLYIDNIPVTDATGTTVMDDIDFANLGKVEVIKGPSPLYGSYIAGAVNLFTQRPASNQSSIEQQVIGGSYGLFRTNTTVQTSSGNTELRVNYGHQTYGGFRPHSGSAKDYVALTTNTTVSAKQSIATYFSYNNSREELAGEIDSADFYARKAISNDFYVLNNSHVNIESFRTGITSRYQFNKSITNESTVFATGSTLNQAFAHGFTKNQNFSFGGRTAFRFQAVSGNLNGTLGASFIRTNQDAHGNFIPPFVHPPFTPTTTPNIPSAARNYAMNYNVFTQWTFALPEQLSLVAGGSLNFMEFGTQNLLNNGTIYLDNPILVKVFKPTFTPDVSLIKVFNTNFSVYGSVSTGYAPPTLSQMTTTAGVVNQNLKPEKAIQYEIGTKGSAGAGKKLSYQVALFDLVVTDRLIQQTANSVSFYTNASKQRNVGAEAYISYAAINNKDAAITLLRPWLSYSYSHFTYINFQNHGKATSGGDTLLADYSGYKVAAVPADVLNIGLDVMTKGGFYLNVTYRYTDKAPITFDNQHYMKTYNLLSARIGYKKQLGNHFNADVFAGGDNLLGTTYYSFLFIGQNIRELAQSTDPYISGGGGDGYILPAPYKATFYGGASLRYSF